MHELSIADSLVSTALEALRVAEGETPAKVEEVRLRLGLLAGVEKDSLLFCYDIVIEGTPLAGSRLVIEELPVVVHCPRCERDVELPGLYSFLCPHCGEPSSDIRQGRELELASIRLAEPGRTVAD